MNAGTNQVVAHLLNVDALAAQNQGDTDRAEEMRRIAEHCKAGAEGALEMAREARTAWAETMAE